MGTELATITPKIESVLMEGNLAQLAPAERVSYYRSVCQSLGLNELTRPFEYITLNGKLVLYARRDCTEQLRKLNRVSIEIVSREMQSDCYVVTAKATDGHGRVDSSIGVVPLPDSTKGEARANAMMKAETKAKRRVTLSICGLGMLDEADLPEPPTNVGILDKMSARVAAPVAGHVAGVVDSPEPIRDVVFEDSREPGSDDDESPSTSEPSGNDDVECYAVNKGTGEITITGFEPRRTLEQNAKIHACFKEGGWSEEQKHAACVRYHKESTANLSIREATDYIDRMEKKLGRARQMQKELGDAGLGK